MEDDELIFLKEQSGINNLEVLKQHIIAVQTKASSVYNYPCIRSFQFARYPHRTKISTYPAYQHVLSMGRERQSTILLDLGCCFGTDIRKAASDGFPRENLIANDLYTFDPGFLKPSEPMTSPFEVLLPAPVLAVVTSLSDLRGHVAAIHISYVFHLFPEARQLQLARALAGLLSPAPGSVLFGSHIGRLSKGFRELHVVTGEYMFCHSPESWRDMWEEVFPTGTIKVDAEFESRVLPGRKESIDGLLTWSVTRL
ncbi:hypothetical protein C8R44DRAFT_831585 [Mycena epipterygia]|nr:hypothetical protein C8R44DRAFT_831585 [Mycena epipterygia]